MACITGYRIPHEYCQDRRNSVLELQQNGEEFVKKAMPHHIIIIASIQSMCMRQTRALVSMVPSHHVYPERLAKLHISNQNQPAHSSSHLNLPETVLPPRPARILLCHAIFTSQLCLAAAKAVTIPPPRLSLFPASRRG